MREDQKRMRAEHERYFTGYKGDIYRSYTRMVRHLLSYTQVRGDRPLVLYSDEKSDYRGVLKPLIAAGRVTHIQVPSTEPRTVHNELFAVNYFDRELRKDSGNHVRETVEFSREVNNCVDRMWVYALYHNYLKPYRIGRTPGDRTTHAEQAGIPRKAIQSCLKTLFTQRFFVSKVVLTESEWYAWYRCYVTPLVLRPPVFPYYAAA